MSIQSNSLRKTLQNFTYRSPIPTGLILMAIGLLFKWVDTFVLRLDERLSPLPVD